MDFETQRLELTTIYNEYKSFFPKCELIISKAVSTSTNTVQLGNDEDIYAKIINKKKSSNTGVDNHILLETQEGKSLIISVDIKGWHSLNDVTTGELQSTYYETFEALMNNLSPNFQLKFGNELSNKLNDLFQLQQSQ
ncbi:GSKIP domain-containing protein [Scheffersomyces coipomensis]|uniref:GSKIP domain-containing protein n=1 Tax=Scheffersomyces coipomensis TaxID=1788519 RepID=UPI00315CC8EF